MEPSLPPEANRASIMSTSFEVTIPPPVADFASPVMRKFKRLARAGVIAGAETPVSNIISASMPSMRSCTLGWLPFRQCSWVTHSGSTAGTALDANATSLPPSAITWPATNNVSRRKATAAIVRKDLSQLMPTLPCHERWAEATRSITVHPDRAPREAPTKHVTFLCTTTTKISQSRSNHKSGRWRILTLRTVWRCVPPETVGK
mmetsp:Transcript_63315/g.125209  ORF Transcript_63315/g.125209 Transcript_63315/m.125209 type:complete len:204 (+) Transcript_63315:572-1183(+)